MRGKRSELSRGRVNNWARLRKRGARFTVGKSPAYNAFCQDAAFHAAVAQGHAAPLEAPVHVSIDVYWPAQHRKGVAAGLALIDVDAMPKALLDSMEVGGVLPDDSIVTSLHVSKHVDPSDPRIEVSAWTLENGAEPG